MTCNQKRFTISEVAVVDWHDVMTPWPAPYAASTACVNEQ